MRWQPDAISDAKSSGKRTRPVASLSDSGRASSIVISLARLAVSSHGMQETFVRGLRFRMHREITRSVMPRNNCTAQSLRLASYALSPSSFSGYSANNSQQSLRLSPFVMITFMIIMHFWINSPKHIIFSVNLRDSSHILLVSAELPITPSLHHSSAAFVHFLFITIQTILISVTKYIDNDHVSDFI